MIYFQAEMQDLTKIEAALGMAKDKSKTVLRSAINQTAKETVSLLVDEAGKEYYIKNKSSIGKTLNRKKATVGDLTAVITSTGKTTELYDFRVSPRSYSPKHRPAGGHTANVKVGNPAKHLYLKPDASGDKYKAFIVKFKNGHKSVAQRVPGTEMESSSGREAIKTLRSTSIPAMLGNEEGVYRVVNPKIQDMLQKNIQEQIQRFLK